MALLLVLGVVGALIAALFLGYTVADSNYLILLLLFGGVATIGICLALRANIWILMVATSGLGGSITILPIPFSISEMIVILTFGMFIIFYAMKAVPAIARPKAIDLLLYLNLAYLVSVYLRNPAGVRFFGTDIIGARPYVAIALSFCSYLVLQHITVSAKLAFRLPWITNLGFFLNSLIAGLANLFPSVGLRIYPFYSSAGTAGLDTSSGDTEDKGPMEVRQTRFSGLGIRTCTLLASYFSPTSLVLFIKPLLSLLFYSAIFLALLGGYRNMVAGMLFFLVASTFFRNGAPSAVAMAAAAMLGYIGIAGLVGAGVQVPLPAQRALSFLPGPWDPDMVADTEGSFEWRFDMWREALTSERYIRNKILGDGFGYRQEEFAAFVAMRDYTGTASSEMVQEILLMSGAYHSGPISTIRYAGVVGLILITILMFALARYGWKLIEESRESPFFPLALLLGIGVIYQPINFWLIFGAYENDLPGSMTSLAMLNLLARSLRKWKSEQNPPSTSLYTPSLPPSMLPRRPLSGALLRNSKRRKSHFSPWQPPS